MHTHTRTHTLKTLLICSQNRCLVRLPLCRCLSLFPVLTQTRAHAQRFCLHAVSRQHNQHKRQTCRFRLLLLCLGPHTHTRMHTRTRTRTHPHTLLWMNETTARVIALLCLLFRKRGTRTEERETETETHTEARSPNNNNNNNSNRSCCHHTPSYCLPPHTVRLCLCPRRCLCDK